MRDFDLTYKPYGNSAILIEWPQKIDKNILYDILFFKEKIVNYKHKVIVEVINTYSSITIIYSSTIENIYSEISSLKSIYFEEITLPSATYNRWKIPVCYDRSFGVDLDEISRRNDVSVSRIIKLHSEAIYTVYFIGFLPGFLYLGGLPEMLHISRKENPRLSIPKGSVAIGGSQTGVYPVDTPGGWQIIGRSPITFFDVHAASPCFAKAGDEIVFDPVDLNTFRAIEKEVAAGSYQLNKTAL